MTMANLISKRMADGARHLSGQLNSRLSRRASAGVEVATALDEWEAEGGAPAGVPQAGEHGAANSSALERPLLQRLGAVARFLHGRNKPDPV